MRVLLAVGLAGCMLAGCVEETDPSLGGARDAATPPAEPAAAPVPESVGASSIAVTLRDSALTISGDQAPAGTVSFQVRNTGRLPHGLAVHGGPETLDSGPIAPGDSLTMSVALAAGTYELLCPLTDGGTHADAGERISLRVR